MGESIDDLFKACYVLFNEFKDVENNERVLLFVEEYEHIEDAEIRKAEINRLLSRSSQNDVTAKVGIAYFKEGVEEKDDYLLIVPRDGSPKFKWGDMVNMKPLLEAASGKKNMR